MRRGEGRQPRVLVLADKTRLLNLLKGYDVPNSGGCKQIQVN